MKDNLEMIFPIGYIYVVYGDKVKLPPIGKWKFLSKEITALGLIKYYVRIK